MKCAAILLAMLLLSVPGGAARATVPWNPAGAESLNVTILGTWPVNTVRGVWDCAGYADSQGREYAMIGADSVYVLNVENPRVPRRVTTFPPIAPPVVNHYVAIATWRHFAYVAARHGPILVIDLADPEHPFVAGQIPSTMFCSCGCGPPCANPDDPVIEGLEIDERGVLYVTGIQCGEGMHTFDLADPIRPMWLCHVHSRPNNGCSFYIHDADVRDGLMFLSHSRYGSTQKPYWSIHETNPLCPQNPTDCGDNQTPLLISAFRHDEPDLHSHSATRMDNPRFLMTCDELTNGHVRIWDIADPATPFQVGSFHPDSTCHTVHHVYSKGNLAYAAWYNKGVQVYDVSVPQHPVRVGYYQHPIRWSARPGDPCCDPTQVPAHCSGVNFLDPFLPSGIFLASDEAGALLIGRFTPPAIGQPEAEPLSGERLVVTNPSAREFRIEWIAGGTDPAGSANPAAPAVALEIFSAGGRLLARLGEATVIGDSRIYRWDGRDSAGRSVPSGLYFVRPGGSGRDRPRGKILVADW